jgi:HPr kinase/phosphorylase
MSNHHASCVALGPRGVLIRGASGAGKSTLTLQLIDQPGYGLGGQLVRGRLVSDDQTMLQVAQGKLIASPPPPLAGLLEIRGLGIQKMKFKPSATVNLVVDLVPPEQVARLPAATEMQVEILGLHLPRLALAQRHPAGAALIRAALRALA